jgi:LacI family transcriptional regulator
MSIKEIAKRAGVSTATVSRAINRIPTVDPGLARRVWKIVDELGYYPDRQHARLSQAKAGYSGSLCQSSPIPSFPKSWRPSRRWHSNTITKFF